MLSGCWFTAGRTRGEDKHLCLIVFISYARVAKQACFVRCVGALLWWISVFCGAESSRHGEPGNPGGRSGHRSDYHITVLWMSCIIIHPQWGCMFVCVGSLVTAIDSLCLTIWYNYCLSFIISYFFSFCSIYLVCSVCSASFRPYLVSLALFCCFTHSSGQYQHAAVGGKCRLDDKWSFYPIALHHCCVYILSRYTSQKQQASFYSCLYLGLDIWSNH